MHAGGRRMADRRTGEMDCLCCGKVIPVRESETGTIHAPCAWCSLPMYAKAGTKAARILAGRTRWEGGETVGSQSPSPKQGQEKKTIATKTDEKPSGRKSIFDIG